MNINWNDHETVQTELPTLTLGPEFEQEVVKTSENVNSGIQQALSPQEQKIVDEFAAKIEVRNSAMILQYGSSAQTKIAAFSEKTLETIKTKDLGEVGKLMTSLVGELKGFAVNEEDKGFMGLFKKTVNSVTTLKTKYDKADVNVDKIAEVLENHQITMLKDIAVLDEMYRLNLANFKELSLYVLAGKKKIGELVAVDLPQAVAKAERSKLPEDYQEANDLGAMINRFEKKIHDLELTRAISIQMAPQIRLIQNNDTLMVEKIQSSLVNTIPLWKSQMVLALGLASSKQAMEAQRSVSDFTNQLLKKNADALKQGTIDVAIESERGIVELETLQHTNQQLIDTLDEVVKIQTEGREKRAQASVALAQIEVALKNKLIDMRR